MTEPEIRQLRDNIYGLPDDVDPEKHKISDGSWATIKHRWMTPENVRWLIEHQASIS